MNINYEKCARYIIFAGAAIAVIFVVLLGCYGFIFKLTKLDTNISAHVGNFIGGIVGTIWSLGGVFLFYSSLKAQRKSIEIQTASHQVECYLKAMSVIRKSPYYKGDINSYKQANSQFKKDSNKYNFNEKMNRIYSNGTISEFPPHS